MKKICGINFFIICLLCYSKTLMGMDAHNPLSGLQSVAVPVLTYQEEIKKLPALVQKDATEFYEKMHDPLLTWATKSKNSYVKNWSVFFIHTIFQKEMKLSSHSVNTKNINDALKNLFTGKKNQSQECLNKVRDLFYRATDIKGTKNSYVDTSVFYNHLNKDASFKKIKDDNAYAQFLLGFLQLVEGEQTSAEQTILNGHFQLTMAAFGLCAISLDVLSAQKGKQVKALCNKIRENQTMLKKPMNAEFIKQVIKNKIFFDYEQSLFFTRFTEEYQKNMVDVTNNRFDHFITIAYGELSDDQKALYKDTGDILREKLIGKRDAASLFSAVSWKLNIVVPSVISLVVGIITFISLDYDSDQKNTSIINGSFSLIGAVFTPLYGFYQWYKGVHVPTYCEKQIKLIALYYAASCTVIHATAGAIVKPFIDYLEEEYDYSITLSQNALNQLKKGVRK